MEYALRDIKAAEKNAKCIIEEAENEKNEIISTARHESLKIFNSEKEKIDRERDSEIKKRSREIDDKKRSIMSDGASDAKKIEEKAKKNMNDAENFVTRKFNEKIKSME